MKTKTPWHEASRLVMGRIQFLQERTNYLQSNWLLAFTSLIEQGENIMEVQRLITKFEFLTKKANEEIENEN